MKLDKHRKINLVFYLILILKSPLFAANLPKTEDTISVNFMVSGDLTGVYEFDGPLGTQITALNSDPNAPCEISSLFRKVRYRGANSVEAWVKLNCVFEGQKATFKAHRIFLKLDQTQQKIKLPMLAKNLKNVQLEIQELSLKSRKK